MKCLETRTTAEGFKRRRYESANGTRSTTIEVPMYVWKELQLALKHKSESDAMQGARGRERTDTQQLKRWPW